MTGNYRHLGAPLSLVFCLALTAGTAAQTLAEQTQAVQPQAAQWMANDPRFSTFSEAVEAAGIGDALNDPPLTLFVPTDEAFARLPEAVAAGVAKPANAAAIRELLSLHVVPRGPHEVDDIPVEMRTLSGARLVATYTRGALTLRIAPPDATDNLEPLLDARAANEARIVFGDVEAGKDVLIHGIDRVLLPPDFALDDSKDQPGEVSPGQTTAGDDTNGTTTDGTDGYVEEIAGIDEGDTVDLPQPDTMPDDTNEASTRMGNDRDAQGAGTARDPDAAGTTATVPEPGIVTLMPKDEPDADDQTRRNPAPAHDAAGDEKDAEGAAGTPALELTGDLVSVDELLDKPVHRADGTRVGRVGDLLVSLSGARVKTLVIEIEGGLFDFGAPETRRVDVRALSVDPLDGTVVLDDGAAEGAE